MLIEVEKQVDMISGNANNANSSGKHRSPSQRNDSARDLSPHSRKNSFDHDDFLGGYDGSGSGTQFMLKAILAKLQEDKNASNGLASPHSASPSKGG